MATTANFNKHQTGYKSNSQILCIDLVVVAEDHLQHVLEIFV